MIEENFRYILILKLSYKYSSQTIIVEMGILFFRQNTYISKYRYKSTLKHYLGVIVFFKIYSYFKKVRLDQS